MSERAVMRAAAFLRRLASSTAKSPDKRHAIEATSRYH